MTESAPGVPNISLTQDTDGNKLIDFGSAGTMNYRELVVLGSGPAGLTAAIYAGRANLCPLVLEGEMHSPGDQPGGQLMMTTDVENYPGFADGILGPELMKRFRGQAERFGVEFVQARASRVNFQPGLLEITTGHSAGEGATYQATTAIVATGAQALLLGLPSEERLMGRGVSTCATCDGFFFQDQDIAVVGGGDSALEEAIFLTKFARNVTVIHRRKELRASKIMQDRAARNPKIKFRLDCIVDEVLGDSVVGGVRVHDSVSYRTTEIAVTGLFVAIGHRPNTGIFEGQLAMDEMGYLLTGPGTATNVAGVFACGDVQDHVYRQAITAAGSGCMAAIDAERWLERHADARHAHERSTGKASVSGAY